MMGMDSDQKVIEVALFSRIEWKTEWVTGVLVEEKGTLLHFLCLITCTFLMTC